ncbi:hypothetical protein F5X99DRAFT_417224 [Biscogniauxia marginata]|nr:hypothetical protein F5X99DRAFT_417224 [Biscogniauxia marginata]
MSATMFERLPVSRKILEIADYHELRGACKQAPLKSVELLDVVLKPSEPYKARHPIKKDNWSEMDAYWHETGWKYKIKRQKWLQLLHKEFWKGQGRLTCDRKVCFVCLDQAALKTMPEDFLLTYQDVQLNWVAIPWNSGDGQPTTPTHPWALVLRRQLTPEYPYLDSFHRMLKERGLVNLAESGFPRSLLKQGTVPLPETLRDWPMGVPGETVALPYLALTSEESA